MKLAVEKGRSTRRHQARHLRRAGAACTHIVNFCHKIGLTDVSSSPFRVPVARLAAAQAALEEEAAEAAKKPAKKK